MARVIEDDSAGDCHGRKPIEGVSLPSLLGCKVQGLGFRGLGVRVWD